MKERIKSYLVFTSLGFRILAFAVAPILLFLFGAGCTLFMNLPGYMLVIFFLIPVEMWLDYINFGGLCEKNVSHLDYVKGSGKGEKIMKHALIGNVNRMFISGTVVVALNFCVWYFGVDGAVISGNVILFILTMLLSAFGIIMLGIMIGRFFDSMQVYVLLSLAGVGIEALLIYLSVANRYLILAISLVIAIVFCVLSVVIAMKHIKESYYDKTVKDGI